MKRLFPFLFAFLFSTIGFSQTKEQLESRLSSLYGGRLAEELIFGKEHVTTGASNDIQVATNIARSMVTKWGLSDKLGPLLYDEEDEQPFLGHSMGKSAKGISGELLKMIDEEVRHFIDKNYIRAEKILADNTDILHSMTEALMEYETIDSAQVDDLMARRPVRKPGDWTVSYKDEEGIGDHPEIKDPKKSAAEAVPELSEKSSDTPPQEP